MSKIGFGSRFLGAPKIAFGVLAVALAAFVALRAEAAPMPLEVKVTATDPMLPEKATTTDVLQQGFTAQLLFGGQARLPDNITDVHYGSWTVTKVDFSPSNPKDAGYKPPQNMGVWEAVQGVGDGSRQTLTQLNFPKAGHWEVTVSAVAGYQIGAPQDHKRDTKKNECIVKIDILQQPLKIIINGTEDELGSPKKTDDFVPVSVPKMPRPYVPVEVTLGREGFSAPYSPQEVSVKVSVGGKLMDAQGAEWSESVIRVTPGGPGVKLKLFGVQPSAGWDADFIEAKLVTPPAAFREAGPVKEDFTAFRLERGVVVGSVKALNPGDAHSTVDPANVQLYEEGSDRVPFYNQKAKIRFGAVLTPEAPGSGGSITHDVLNKVLGNRLVWTLPEVGIYKNKDFAGNPGSTIGDPRKKEYQAVGLDWPEGKSVGGPFIEVSKDKKMPPNNDGFGPLSEPTCELRWPTVLNEKDAVKVAEVKGQVPRLFFQRFGSDHPKGPKDNSSANWYYYWATEQKGTGASVCSYSLATARYEQPIVYKGTTTAWGIFRNGHISMSDRTVTHPADWTFPSNLAAPPNPKPDLTKWVAASWNGIAGPDFVDLTFAHESTHQKIAGLHDPDEDHDRVPTAWEKDVLGMNPKDANSFGSYFGISAESDAHRDEEFYCTLGGAAGRGTVTPGTVRDKYQGVKAPAATNASDWSVNGSNW